MRKASPKQKRAEAVAEAKPIVAVEVAFTGKAEDAVTIRDDDGQKISHAEAIKKVRDATGYSARELGHRVGVDMRTVHGWAIGRPINVRAALALKGVLETDELLKLTIQAGKSQNIQSGGGSPPSGASQGKNGSKNA